MHIVSTLLASLAFSGAVATPRRGRGPPGHDLTARTKAGTFTGFVDPEVPDVRQWLGVPYGAPPVGNQRSSAKTRNSRR